MDKSDIVNNALVAGLILEGAYAGLGFYHGVGDAVLGSKFLEQPEHVLVPPILVQASLEALIGLAGGAFIGTKYSAGNKIANATIGALVGTYTGAVLGTLSATIPTVLGYGLGYYVSHALN